MSIESCPHCDNRVMFKEDGICPACGQNKNKPSQKINDPKLIESNKDEIIKKINLQSKSVKTLIISGVLILVLTIGLFTVTLIKRSIEIFSLFGLILALLLFRMADKASRNKQNLQEEYHEKYKN